MKKLLIYVMYLFCSTLNSSQKITNEDTVLIKKINDIVIPFLKKNKMSIFIVSTITVLIITVILRHILKELDKIKFYTCEFKIDEFFSATPGLEQDIEKIEKMEFKELNSLIECIQSIIDEESRKESVETALQDAQEEEEKKEKISSQDLNTINRCIEGLKKITDKAILEEEIKENKKERNGYDKDKIETPKQNIPSDNETDLLKYEGFNFINSLEDSKNCIIERSKDLLKVILTKNEAEKDFLLSKFKTAMSLLDKTKVKKFKNINCKIDALIKLVDNEIKNKDNRSDYDYV